MSRLVVAPQQISLTFDAGEVLVIGTKLSSPVYLTFMMNFSLKGKTVR